jgi:hypothetical protein
MDLFSFPRIFLSYQNVSILYIADQNIYQQIHKQEANSLKKHIQEAIRIKTNKLKELAEKKAKGNTSHLNQSKQTLVSCFYLSFFIKI